MMLISGESLPKTDTGQGVESCVLKDMLALLWSYYLNDISAGGESLPLCLISGPLI